MILESIVIKESILMKESILEMFLYDRQGSKT